jgi:hypothetical protein
MYTLETFAGFAFFAAFAFFAGFAFFADFFLFFLASERFSSVSES